MLDVTTKPVVFDADNGGRIEHMSYKINSLERQGVSTIVWKNRIKKILFLKIKNAQQDSINFLQKIESCQNQKF